MYLHVMILRTGVNDETFLVRVMKRPNFLKAYFTYNAIFHFVSLMQKLLILNRKHFFELKSYYYKKIFKV